jgi:hypothetical protein
MLTANRSPLAPTEPPTTSAVATEPLTWSEICARYPDQWVCLVDIGWRNDTDFDFATARVAGNGKTRNEPLVQARSVQAHYGEVGHFYTGRIVAPPLRYGLPDEG